MNLCHEGATMKMISCLVYFLCSLPFLSGCWLQSDQITITKTGDIEFEPLVTVKDSAKEMDFDVIDTISSEFVKVLITAVAECDHARLRPILKGQTEKTTQARLLLHSACCIAVCRRLPLDIRNWTFCGSLFLLLIRA